MPIVKIVPMPGPQGPTGQATSGATGTFVSNDNKTITVTNGIITAIQAIV
jgi:hypothetical protein